VTHNGSWLSLVWDGQRRVMAGLKELDDDAMIEVIDLSDDPVDLTPDKADELMIQALEVGSKRAGLASFELAEVAASLRARGKKLSEISDAIGKDESWVSKVLKARDHASPKLLFAWRKGEVTDEQFKELAQAKETDQDEITKDVVNARQSGDKAEARAKVKEVAETAKQKRKREKEERLAKKHEAKAAKAAVKAAAKAAKTARRPAVKDASVGAGQLAMPLPEPKAPAPQPPKKVTPSKQTLIEMVELSGRRPPTHDLVKGIMLGVKYALGDCTPEDFGKPWMQYLARLGGTAKPSTKARKAKTHTPKLKGKPRRSGTAIARARKRGRK
jgi:transcriptional regulator with XRE-family HTH domain